jgi:hypothetical protein
MHIYQFLKSCPGNPPSQNALCALSVKLIGAAPTATTEIATFNGIKLCLAKMTLFIEAFSFFFFF